MNNEEYEASELRPEYELSDLKPVPRRKMFPRLVKMYEKGIITDEHLTYDFIDLCSDLKFEEVSGFFNILPESVQDRLIEKEPSMPPYEAKEEWDRFKSFSIVANSEPSIYSVEDIDEMRKISNETRRRGWKIFREYLKK
jgi:hypothetical protein